MSATVVLLLVCTGKNSDAMANGVHVDFSNTLGSGNVIHSQYNGLELVLRTYRLQNRKQRFLRLHCEAVQLAGSV